MPISPAFPELAATLPGEAAMLAAGLADPGDDNLKAHQFDRGRCEMQCC